MNERDFFEDNVGRVLRYFANKVRIPADTNDLVQETFLRLFARVKRGDIDIENPATFLLGIAHFVLMEYWKTKGRNLEDPWSGNESVIQMGGAETSLSSVIMRKQVRGRVLDAMRHLSLNYQNVLELRYWHQLTYGEIGTILDQNVSTVGVWLRRAKKDLGKLLEELPISDDAAPFEPHLLEDWLNESGELDTKSGKPSESGESDDE
ncbi:MAG: sigma-70 family RNA polymerase sigma factor [Myxococcota bacterium]